MRGRGTIALRSCQRTGRQYAGEAPYQPGNQDKIQDKVALEPTGRCRQCGRIQHDAGIIIHTDAASMADKVEVVAEAPEALQKVIILWRW